MGASPCCDKPNSEEKQNFVDEKEEKKTEEELLHEKKQALAERLKNKNFTITEVRLYITAIQGERKLLSHPTMFLKIGFDDYLLLEKVNTGIKFEKINSDEYENYIKEQYAQLFGQYKVKIRIQDLVQFIEEEMELNHKYKLFKDNCIHFGYRFGGKFLKNSQTINKFSIAWNYKGFGSFFGDCASFSLPTYRNPTKVVDTSIYDHIIETEPKALEKYHSKR